jgi:hypothetical protein
MFGAAESGNKTTAWILRVVSAVVVTAGIRTFLAPLAAIGAVIPILGHVLGAGANFVGFLLGLAWSLIIIAIAWVRFRPMLGIGLIIAAVVIFALLFIRGHGKKVAAQ